MVVSTPSNIDLMSISNFRVDFAMLPHISYFCQNINVPGVSLSDIESGTHFAPLHIPGDKVNYEQLQISFLVDEDLKTWLEINNWLRYLGRDYRSSQYEQVKTRDGELWNDTYGGGTSDASVHITTNKKNYNFYFLFRDCFPVNISGLDMNVAIDQEQKLVASATFAFNTYDILSPTDDYIGYPNFEDKTT